MKKSIFYFMLMSALFFLAACGPAETEALADEGVEGETAVTESTSGMGMVNGMGTGSSITAVFWLKVRDLGRAVSLWFGCR